MAMPTSVEMTLFDTDLTLVTRPIAAALREVLEERLSVLRDDQAVQARQPGRRVAGGVERRRRGTLAVRAIDREEKDEGQSDKDSPAQLALTLAQTAAWWRCACRWNPSRS